MAMHDQSLMLIDADRRAREARAERDRYREALEGLLECFDGFPGGEDGTGAVMNAGMAWEDVVPRVQAAHAALSRNEAT